MTEDILVVQEMTKFENALRTKEALEYLRFSNEVKHKRKRYELYTIYSMFNIILLVALIREDFSRGRNRLVIALCVLLVYGVIFYKIASALYTNCYYDAIKKRFGHYTLFLFILSQDSDIRKMKIAHKGKVIKIYKKYSKIKVNNSFFEYKGAGNNVYKIDLDGRFIYTD